MAGERLPPQRGGDGSGLSGQQHGNAGSSSRERSQPGGEDRRTRISKEMAQKLRHDPPEGMDGCGFVPVGSLVGSMEHPTSEEEVEHIAKTDEKGRYQLNDGMGAEEELCVQAVQGHSVPLKNPLHDPIKGPEEVPLALHATSEESWREIQKSDELRRVGRTNIHFASQPKHLRGNDWASVLLQVDLGAAIEAGIEFCRAANDVVLAEGPIPLRYVHRIRLQDLPPHWQEAIPNRERLLEEERAQTEGTAAPLASTSSSRRTTLRVSAASKDGSKQGSAKAAAAEAMSRAKGAAEAVLSKAKEAVRQGQEAAKGAAMALEEGYLSSDDEFKRPRTGVEKTKMWREAGM